MFLFLKYVQPTQFERYVGVKDEEKDGVDHDHKELLDSA